MYVGHHLNLTKQIGKSLTLDDYCMGDLTSFFIVSAIAMQALEKADSTLLDKAELKSEKASDDNSTEQTVVMMSPAHDAKGMYDLQPAQFYGHLLIYYIWLHIRAI